jgi:hypothetical protein
VTAADWRSARGGELLIIAHDAPIRQDRCIKSAQSRSGGRQQCRVELIRSQVVLSPFRFQEVSVGPIRESGGGRHGASAGVAFRHVVAFPMAFHVMGWRQWPP